MTQIPIDHSAPRNPGLRDIRTKVKEVMIPLLVGVFEAKMTLQQAQNPTRLHAATRESPEKLRKQLEELQEDINMLLLWCQSCKTQIGKALENESPRQQHTISSQSASHPAMQKSFADAINAQNIRPAAQVEPAKESPLKKMLQFIRRLKDNPRP